MPICPHCSAEVQAEDIFCGNCGGDLTETVGPEKAPLPESVEEGDILPPAGEEEEMETNRGLPSPPEVVSETEAPAWISPTSRTLWIVVAVVLLMLLCCCGLLGLIALVRILSQSPLLRPNPLL